MANRADYSEAVAALAEELETKGFAPILVGGMALIVLGSQRVTKEFDFLVSMQGPPAEDLVKTMYHHRLELVAKFKPTGEVLRTVDNAAVAKVKAERSQSIFFYSWKTGLRVDLLLDFPLPALGVGRRAIRVKLGAGQIYVASPEDLLRLKEIALRDRKSPADAQDAEFLRRMIGERP